jgi:Ca2+-binding EF-hand superfamily protein
MLSANHHEKYFTQQELNDILKQMNIKLTKTEIERMIWEFDEDLNKKITEK